MVTCVAGNQNTACGYNGQACVDCGSLDTSGETYVCGAASPPTQRCALTAGSSVPCSQCSNYNDWFCATDNCGLTGFGSSSCDCK